MIFHSCESYCAEESGNAPCIGCKERSRISLSLPVHPVTVQLPTASAAASSVHWKSVIQSFAAWSPSSCVVLVGWLQDLPIRVSFHTVKIALNLTFQGGYWCSYMSKKVKGHQPVVEWTLYLQMVTHFSLLLLLSVAATTLLPYEFHMTSQLTLLCRFSHNKLLAELLPAEHRLHKIWHLCVWCHVKLRRWDS